MGETIIPAADQDALFEKAVALLEAARERGLTCGTAESCTGGLVSAALTAVPGSSDVHQGAVVSYACSVKVALLGVSQRTLDTVGAVSEDCARQMAEGAREALHCDVALSTTGIAGPGGAVPGKPVGTVWYAVATPTGTVARLGTFPGDRSQVRAQAVAAVLDLACGVLVDA